MKTLPDHVGKLYKERLLAHITAVQEYGAKIGVDPYLLYIHDVSKWDVEEFVPYAWRFCSDMPKEESATMFAEAWLHHIHHNPHHWQHWMFPDKFNLPGSNLENGVAPMPNRYALEMIADWHGAGYAYNKSWDCSKWLFENIPRITVHSETATYLRIQLTNLGYPENVVNQAFAHEAW